MDSVSIVTYTISSVITLIAGGFSGAIYNARRTKPQPVAKRIGIDHVLKPQLHSTLTPKLTIYDNGKPYEYSNLYVVAIELTNRGNRDVYPYRFGIRLREGDRIVYLEYAFPTPAHKVSFKPGATPVSPARQIDVEFNLFNRGDSYTVIFFVVTDPLDLPLSPADVEVYSGEPGTKLIDVGRWMAATQDDRFMLLAIFIGFTLTFIAASLAYFAFG